MAAGEILASVHPVLLIGNFLSGRGRNPGPCEELAARLAGRGWPVQTTSSRSSRLGRLADMMTTAWAGRRCYQVAHVEVYSGAAFLWAEAVCRVLRRADKPFVLTLHGGNLPRFAARWQGRVRALLEPAAAVTTPSRYLVETMRRYRPDLRLLPNPVDLARYSFQVRERPRPTLVWLRAFHRVYNPPLAVETLARLAGEFPAARLALIGPDKRDGSREATLGRARLLGVAGWVSLVGAVTKAEVPERLQAGDIFLNTSNVDNAPVSVVEAMACGLCVVSTAVGGLPYLVEHEVDGLLVPPEDPEAMAGAVRRILLEPGLAARLSRAARAKAQQFDWSRVLPQWESLLAAVAAGRRV